MTESEYFPLATGGQWARLTFTNAALMPATGVVESAAETAQRLADCLRRLVPAAVYAELVPLLLAEAAQAELVTLLAEPGAEAFDEGAAAFDEGATSLWDATYPDLPAWHELEAVVRAEFRAFLTLCLARHQVAGGPDDWLIRRRRDDRGGTPNGDE